MTVLKEFNPSTGTWEPILAGVKGDTGLTGPIGPVGATGPAGPAGSNTLLVASSPETQTGLAVDKANTPASTADMLERRRAMTFAGTTGTFVETFGFKLPLSDFTVKARGIKPSTTWRPSSAQTLWCQHRTTSNQRKIALTLLNTGQLRIVQSTDGINVANLDSTAAMPNNNAEYSIAITRDGDDGAGNRIYRWWLSTDGGSTWVKFDERITATTTPLFDSTGAVQIGGLSNNASQPFSGTIESLSACSDIGRNGYPGSLEIGEVHGYTLPYVDSHANTWTVTGTIGATRLPTRSQTQTAFDVREFISGGALSSNDDWTSTVQAGLDHVQLNNATLRFPTMVGFVTAPLVINNGCHVQGAPGFGTRLIAAPTLNDFIIKASAIGGSAFISGLRIHDLFLDGNGRAANAGGIYLKQVQRAKVTDIQCRYLPRGGFYGEAFRNSHVENMWGRHNGDADQGYADYTLYEPATGSADRCNMLRFVGIESIYPFGRFLRVRSDNNALPIYSVYFTNTWFHGETSATGNQVSDGYTFAQDVRQFATGVVLQGVQNLRLLNPYFEIGKNGSPYIVTDDNGTGAASNSSVVVSDAYFGNTGHLDVVVTSVDPTSDQLTITPSYDLPQCAMVRLTTTGTLPAGLALATDYFVRRVSATAFTLHATRYRAEAGTNIIDITAAGSGVLTVSTQESSVLLYRAAGLRLQAAARTGSPNRPYVVDKHGASTSFSGMDGDVSNHASLYEGTSTVVHNEGVSFATP